MGETLLALLGDQLPTAVWGRGIGYCGCSFQESWLPISWLELFLSGCFKECKLTELSLKNLLLILINSFLMDFIVLIQVNYLAFQ